LKHHDIVRELLLSGIDANPRWLTGELDAIEEQIRRLLNGMRGIQKGRTF
jgi:hypothetical protein